MLRVVEGAGREWLVIEVHFPGTHAKAQGGVDSVHHVQVVRPGFGPVFPRMHRRVGADVMLLPVQRRTLLVMPLKGFGVARSIVAEQATKRFQPMAVGDQSIPVVMADLMTEVPEQRAIRLVHLHPNLFADRKSTRLNSSHIT